MKELIAFLFCFFSLSAFCQEVAKFTLSGFIREEATGEAVIGAPIFIKEIGKGTSTNVYGFYSLTLDQGNYTVLIQYLGFKSVQQKVDLTSDQRLNVNLVSESKITEEVVVTRDKPDDNVKGTEMGTMKLEMEQINKLPAFMGEVDILKTIQLLPGVKSSGDGNSGFYVRGGGPDQNLILLDEAVVYNAAHLFGFFSVFNGDAVKNINLIKGGMPSQYGGRLSSVLDISMKEGNNKKFVVEGGVGLISSRITAQGPIKKDTSSFIVSARRTYIDVLMKPFIKKSSPFRGSGYYFYDLNMKVNYRLSDKDRLFLSGYFGRDVFNYNNAESGFLVDIPWGNATTSLRWNHLFSDKMFMNTSLIFSDYKFEFGAEQSGFEFRLFSGIRDYNAKVDFSYFPVMKHEIKFGANYVFHTFTPSSASAKSGEVEFDLGKVMKQYAHDAAVYIGDEFEVNKKIKINAGLRGSWFMQVGPFDRYIKDVMERHIIDTVSYEKGEKVKAYGGLEPRISGRFTVNERSSIKASFTRNLQYIHLTSTGSVSLPTDVWVSSSDKVKPQIGTQYAVGYFQNFKNNAYESSVEIYYRDMKNLVEFKPGAQPEDNAKDNTDNNFIFGNGWSYGSEFFLKKREGKFNGWVGYTLSWTKRKFEGIDQGRVFYAKYDRRHDVSIALTYDLSEKWSFSTVFVYGTGNAVTLPSSRYLMEGNVVPQYGAYNDFRMAPYHRMDISATLQGKKRKNFESSWNFAVYNVYNRMNPYFIYFDTEGSAEQANLKVTAKQVSLFPILPSATWNFKF